MKKVEITKKHTPTNEQEFICENFRNCILDEDEKNFRRLITFLSASLATRVEVILLSPAQTGRWEMIKKNNIGSFILFGELYALNK